MGVDPSAVLHPSSVVEEGAIIGANARIGPFCVIGPDAELGADVVLHSHVVISGKTKIGDGTEIFPFASIGNIPQDLKYQGEDTSLIIGARNRIRENVTINPGTTGGSRLTQIGDDNLIMIGVHVGHDCIIGSGVVLANFVQLGGHCQIEDKVVIGALAGIHQFTRIGKGAIVGGHSAVVSDVIPYGAVAGERASLNGLNLTGLKRAQVDRAMVHELRAFYTDLFEADQPIMDALAAHQHRGETNALISEMITFLTKGGKRSLTVPRAG